ncbi:MAG: Rieske 2Fe-2S domain-containing protein [Melioribacteraceae bacterium]|nr:Rieske 2Fe-2S domain-containing protein [Melioribacteraceae bacterium]
MLTDIELHKLGCDISRRDFINKSAKTIGGIAVGSFVVTFINACSGDDSSPTSPNGNGNGGGTVQLTVDISSAQNSSLQTVGGMLTLGANDIDPQGIFIYRQSESSVIAFSRECTHERCQVGSFASNNIATCPCHGSQYNQLGNVVTGPAASSLRRYTAVLEGNIITITR